MVVFVYIFINVSMMIIIRGLNIKYILSNSSVLFT